MAIKIVVAGLGARGQEWVRELKSSPGFEISGCVDTDRTTLEGASRRLQIPSRQCFSDLRQALDHDGCQAVIVATPADQHVQACEAALSRKLAVLVEKPFSLHLSEAANLVSLAESNSTPLLVAQNYRYMRSFRTARRLMREGTLGRVGMVIFQYYRPPHEIRGSLAQLQHNVLWGVGIHHLDALRYVLGKKITNVTAESFTLPWGQLPQGASMRVMLSFEDETRAFYSATYESSGHEFFERGQEFYARFVGERATLHVLQRWLILCENGKLPRLVMRGPRKVTEERILLNQLERAMLAEEEPDSSGRDNLQTMAVIEACLRSAAERTWVNPQELLDEHQ